MNNCGDWKNKIKKILRQKSGFTFTEMLIATLIMVLATGALTAALTLAIRHFYLSTQRTEEQLLCASLAEFVEDELSFSKVDDTDGSWAKGTHNMGSGIRFYLLPNGESTYAPVTGDPVSRFGKIAIKGDNYPDGYFHIVSDGSYDVEPHRGYSLAAGMSLQWDASNKWYVVEIKVVDQDDQELSDAKFTVKPLIETT